MSCRWGSENHPDTKSCLGVVGKKTREHSDKVCASQVRLIQKIKNKKYRHARMEGGEREDIKKKR